MASLFERERSPFWWINCRDCKPESPTFGKVIQFSTKLRVGVGKETRAAKEMCAKLGLAEARFGGSSPNEAWGVWVPDFLAVHCKSAETLKRYKTIWRNVAAFLKEQSIDVPRQLTRARCMEYLTWRTRDKLPVGLYRAVHNTAHLELKVLSLVMGEAVSRDFAPFNPVRDLKIGRHRPKEKPEFSDADLAFIWDAIKNEPADHRQFLANSFLIGRYQGCRLNETCLNPLTDVDIAEDGKSGIIRFRIKGDREHTAPLHPELIPLFQELKKQGMTVTYVKPPNPSRKWFDFMKRIGIRKKVPGACFHSLRVSAVTRLARSKKVSESRAMRFIGHASTTVHRIYQRLKVEDLGDCIEALSGDKRPVPESSGSPAATPELPKDKCSDR